MVKCPGVIGWKANARPGMESVGKCPTMVRGDMSTAGIDRCMSLSTAFLRRARSATRTRRASETHLITRSVSKQEVSIVGGLKNIPTIYYISSMQKIFVVQYFQTLYQLLLHPYYEHSGIRAL